MNEKCQVFTPENYVRELLDSIGYTENLYGKKILENACGDGNVLSGIVRRYIKDCRNHGMSNTHIKNGLSSDIYGVEIDSHQYIKCISNLNRILQEQNISSVEWKIYNFDYLKNDLSLKFDFIVSNPPYITYSEIVEKERKYLKENFKTCTQGKFDYCYAFIEKSIASLSEEGKMSYLIPSSIFKTVFGRNLREMMKYKVDIIHDYTTEKVFKDALVASAIIVLNNNKKKEKFEYLDVVNNKKTTLNRNDLGDKWCFSSRFNIGKRRFGDYFNVSHVIATLLNEAFVIEKWEDVGESILCDGYYIEKEVIRETATPKSLYYKKNELIIFPYYYTNGILKKYEENEFVSKFVGAAGYLNTRREKLDLRKKDKSSKWFEYGRSQALGNIESEKLLMSTVVTGEVKLYQLNKECIPYAGMYITPIGEKMSLEDAKRILVSPKFMNYVNKVGIHVNGSSIRITCKDIMNFNF